MTTDRRPWFLRMLAILAVCALAFTACGDDDDDGGDGDGAGEPPEGEVYIEEIAFNPADITVAAGDEVTWTNFDSVPHTVTAGTPDAPETELFNEELPGAEDTASSTFDEAGEFPYFCEIHPQQMQGTVTVE